MPGIAKAVTRHPPFLKDFFEDVFHPFHYLLLQDALAFIMNFIRAASAALFFTSIYSQRTACDRSL